MEIHTLWPLSQGELEGQPEELVDALFADSLPAPRPPQGGRKPELVDGLVRGGYPEVVGMAAETRRQAWFHVPFEVVWGMPILRERFAKFSSAVERLASSRRSRGSIGCWR
jgi:hypothetical protein